MVECNRTLFWNIRKKASLRLIRLCTLKRKRYSTDTQTNLQADLDIYFPYGNSGEMMLLCVTLLVFDKYNKLPGDHLLSPLCAKSDYSSLICHCALCAKNRPQHFPSFLHIASGSAQVQERKCILMHFSLLLSVSRYFSRDSLEHDAGSGRTRVTCRPCESQGHDVHSLTL